MVAPQCSLQVFSLAAFDGEDFRIASSWEILMDIYPEVQLPELPCDGENFMVLMCRADLHPSEEGSLVLICSRDFLGALSFKIL